MANGTTDRYLAQADRRRDMSDRARAKSEMAIQGVKNSLVNSGRKLPTYSENDSEITANTSGLHAKGIPRFAWWMLGSGIAFFLVCVGVALVLKAR